MEKFEKKLEILAPAKDKNCAIAAINHGADAVYIGAPKFGARKNVPNSISDIKEVVDFAHKFFTKVYVVLNTILTDDEVKVAKELVYKLYDIEVDGIIVQDFAFFNMELPPIPIFASTQCDIRDLKKVKFFEKIGLKRVILARELSLEEIEKICKNTNIEIETFVHGALCVSYSGQCYLSYSQGGRSANRGECAQPCRKKYTLINECGKIIVKDKYLLSLKDFCTLDYLEKLIDAGVTSFKIEGRLKDENYVKNIVGAYNLALGDKNRSGSGKIFYDFEPNVQKSFNRGLCSYFLDSKNSKKSVFNFDTPKSLGKYIGEVANVTNNYFDVKTSIKLNPQDGLYFKNNVGVLINRCEILNKNTTRIFALKVPKINKGDKVYRNLDVEFEKILQNSKTKRRIGVKFEVFENKIVAVDEDNVSAQIEFNSNEIAQNQQKCAQNYKTQLEKLGESDFYSLGIEFSTTNLPFVKISQINTLRRELLQRLIKTRLEIYKKTQLKNRQTKIMPAKFPLKNNDYRLNVHNSFAKDFYKKCSVNCAQNSFESQKFCDNKREVMRTRHCIRAGLDLCFKNNPQEAIKCAKKLFLVSEDNKKFELGFDCTNCEMVVYE